MERPNLELLKMRNELDKYLKGKQPQQQPQQQLKIKFACTLCQGELVHTDWAPTCVKCGAVHECFQCFVREMDFKKPQTKTPYKKMTYFNTKLCQKYKLALSVKQLETIRNDFSRVVYEFQMYKAKQEEKVKFFSYDFLMSKILDARKIPHQICELKTKSVREYNIKLASDLGLFL